MIVTCPSCANRYLVETERLSAQGRMVRCGNCRHTWYQPPPEDSPPRVEFTPPIGPEARPDAYPERRNLPVLHRPRRGRGKLVAVLLILVGGAGATLLLRDRIMAAVPQTERIYRHLGFATDAATGLGLDIRNVTPSRGVDNGEPALLIDGMVLNTGSTPRAVPRLRAVLRDVDNRPIGSWSFDSGITRLGPGESAAFHTLMRQPSDLATGVVVVFDKPQQ